MSVEAIAWVKAQFIPSAPRKLIMMALADRMNNETGECFPGQELIAEECSMEPRTVRDHLPKLEEDRFLERRRRFENGGARTSDAYSFPGFKEWLTHQTESARTYGEKARKSAIGANPPVAGLRQTTGANPPVAGLRQTTGANPPVAEKRQPLAGLRQTTGANPPRNHKKNHKDNRKTQAQQAAPVSPEVPSVEVKLPLKPTAAKPRKQASEWDASFAAFTSVYKATCQAVGKGGTVKGKAQAEKAWLRLDAATQEQITAALPAYGKELRATEYLHPQHISTFINSGWRDYKPEPAEIEAKAASERRTQILAVALDLADRTWTRAVKWWRSISEVPADILAAAKRHAAENFDGFTLQAA